MATEIKGCAKAGLDMSLFEQVKVSQADQILAYLNLDGKSITSYEAYLNFAITQLGARLKELEARGYVIDREWVDKNGKKFKRYTLNKGGEK